MEFLKTILGEEAFATFEAAINKHNESAKKEGDKVKLANLSTGEYVGTGKHKAEVDQLAADKTALEKQIKTLQGNLDDVSKSTNDVEQIKTDAAKAAENSKTAIEDLQTASSESIKNYEIRLAVIGAGAKNEKSVIAHLDTKTIQFVDGKLSGLNGQLEKIKEGHEYLFGESKKVFKTDTVNPPPEPSETSDEWQTKLDEAKKTGKNIDVIRVKQEAQAEGVTLN